MKKHSLQKLEAIIPKTLIVGVDIAKHVHWARFADYRGLPLDKAIRFCNNKEGFESILTSIQELCKQKDLANVLLGMEPTGHYWKPLANYLTGQGINVVLVNPYHTKRAKELDGNNPTKNDQKDALTIARLVRDGRYYQLYMPPRMSLPSLRVLTNSRVSLMRRHNALKNTIMTVMDEYFPEIVTVFKYPLKGKESLQILKYCPFSSVILKLGTAEVLAQIKKAVQKTVGQKKAQELLEVAQNSIGVTLWHSPQPG